jgi:hypothetical protein
MSGFLGNSLAIRGLSWQTRLELVHSGSAIGLSSFLFY